MPPRKMPLPKKITPYKNDPGKYAPIKMPPRKYARPRKNASLKYAPLDNNLSPGRKCLGQNDPRKMFSWKKAANKIMAPEKSCEKISLPGKIPPRKKWPQKKAPGKMSLTKWPL